jgi:hypothetical protein
MLDADATLRSYAAAASAASTMQRPTRFRYKTETGTIIWSISVPVSKVMPDSVTGLVTV